MSTVGTTPNIETGAATQQKLLASNLQPDICMLVHNAATTDVRVMKEARSLSSRGWHVTIIGVLKRSDELPLKESIDGITVIRARSPGWFWQRLRRHLPAALTGSPRSDTWATTSVDADRMGVLARTAASPKRRSGSFAKMALAWQPVLRPVKQAIKEIVASDDGLIIRAKISRILRQVNARVYHAHDYPALAQIYRVFGESVPIVYDSHELFFERQPPDSPRSARQKDYRSDREREKLIARSAAAVITVSDSIAEHMAEKWDIARPIVVRNAVDLRNVGDRAVAYGVTTGKAVVHSGNITFGRHLPELVASLRYLPADISLVLMGTARNSVLGQVFAQAQADQTHERLIVIAAVPMEDIAPTLAQADVGVVLFTSSALNYQLGLPNKVFEYIAAGLPVVVGQAPEIAELTRRYEIGCICDETDPVSIAKAIATVLEPDRYQRYRANVMEARKVLNWQVEEEKLIDLYTSLLAS